MIKPMKRTNYLKRAAERFLHDLDAYSPIEAVERGLRSIEEWLELLEQEREQEMAYFAVHGMRRKRGPRKATLQLAA
jgi:hypothetical protein